MSELAFHNENTILGFEQAGKMEEFHARYEEALKRVRGALGKTHPLVIDGKEVQGSGTFQNVNPANTSEVLGTFQKATAAQVDEAVQAARRAQPAWERLGWEKRVAIFEKAADLMAARKFDLAAIMTLENGKNRVEAMYDVDEATDFLRFYAHQMRAHKGYVLTMGEPFPGEGCVSVMRPWGVFAVIGPFNFPLAIPCGMSTGALITGNAVVLKPATDTPWLSLELVKLLHEAGVPKGVLHYVTGGGREVGQPMIDHPLVDGLVFTGSREVGMKNFASFVGKRPRPYICEMGGKNAIVVTANADLDKAVPGVLKSAFGFGGQKCSACSRAYVHASKYAEFVRRLAEMTKALKVGDPEARDTGFGPLINAGAVETYAGAVKRARDAGGKVVAGGSVLKNGTLAKGHFVEPAVVTDLPAGHEAFRQEYFAPFVAVAKYEDFDQVIAEVNATDYGLTSGIFSEDAREVAAYFDRVQAGVVYANRARGGSTGAMVGGQSFGGWKFSATTARGAGGPHYLEQFMREQSRTTVR